MTVQYEEVPVPACTRTLVHSATCDLCGTVVPYPSLGADMDGHVDWAKPYQVRRTCVALGEGYDYPDGGHTDYLAYHICTGCFKTKLVPWLASQGGPAHPERGRFLKNRWNLLQIGAQIPSCQGGGMMYA